MTRLVRGGRRSPAPGRVYRGVCEGCEAVYGLVVEPARMVAGAARWHEVGCECCGSRVVLDRLPATG